MADGKLAKHGYTVDWGYFHGVCQGAEAKPLEHDKTLTESLIKLLREDVAPRADKLAADLEAGIVDPQWTKRVPDVTNRRTGFVTYKTVSAERHELNDYNQQHQRNAAVCRAQSDARHARSHADMLVKMIEMRHGQPLYPVSDKPTLGVGTRVQIGGKKGWIGEIMEIRDQEARGCGPYLNGRMMPHAVLKRPDGRQIALPVRTIRMSAIVQNA
jgi:hypothetical protein